MFGKGVTAEEREADIARVLQAAIQRLHCPACMTGRPASATMHRSGVVVACRFCAFRFTVPPQELRNLLRYDE